MYLGGRFSEVVVGAMVAVFNLLFYIQFAVTCSVNHEDVMGLTCQVCGGETGTSNIHDFMALDTAERFSPIEP